MSDVGPSRTYGNVRFRAPLCHGRHPTRVIRAASIYEDTPWLVVVDYLHVLRTRVGPPERDPLLLIDADRVLARQVALAVAS